MRQSRFLRIEPVQLDRRAKRLLSLICADGRASATALGRSLRLSREVVSYRMKRLADFGVINGFTIKPRYKKLSERQYRLFLLLDERKKERHKSIVAHMTEHPNTISVIRYSDTWDVGWSFLCTDLDEFDSIVRDLTSRFADAIISHEGFAVLTTYAVNMVPSVQRSHHARRTLKESVFDDTDRRILAALAQDGRAGTYAIAKRTKLGADLVLQRMRRFRDQELIGGYTAVVNLCALGYSWYNYVIRFSRLNESDEAKFAEYVSAHPYILRAVKVFGSWDVMLDIVVEDVEQYHTTAKEIKNMFAEIMRQYESWNVYEEYTYCAFPPVLMLRKERPTIKAPRSPTWT